MSPAIISNGKAKKQSVIPQFTSQVALYMRVSTDEQAEQGTIDTQRDFLRKFANLYQLPVADEYADDGVTGTLPLGERPEGRRLLQDAEAGRFGVVLVYRMTRLGRSLKALIDAHDILSRFVVTIRSATEPFDTSTPVGNFFFQLLGSLAELDRKQVLEQLARGRDRAVQNKKWTDGPIPYGYMVDGERYLIPSSRFVETLKMTEAEVVEDLFQRIAAGSSSVIEARRLNALHVPTTRYYGRGIQRAGVKWYPASIIRIITNPTYKGVHTFESGYGDIARAVPPLVPDDLWERANAQLKRNQRLPKANATRMYLLRGLITCGQCGSSYTGQAYRLRHGNTGAYYRCSRRTGDQYARVERCTGRVVNTSWLEPLIWEDCRWFILNPREALAEAQHQLHDRMHQAARIDQARGEYMKALAEKAQERERIMLFYRRGKMTFEDAERHLDDITREEAELRGQCSAMDAQKALAEAYEAHLTEASLLLHRLQAQLAEIERTDNQTIKRQVIELLVQGIRIDTHQDRSFTVTITYHFSSARVADSSTSCSGCCRRGIL